MREGLGDQLVRLINHIHWIASRGQPSIVGCNHVVVCLLCCGVDNAVCSKHA
jgi:hypothetical protein